MTNLTINSAMADALSAAGKIKTSRVTSKKNTRPARTTKYWKGTDMDAASTIHASSAVTYDGEILEPTCDIFVSYTSDVNSVTFSRTLELVDTAGNAVNVNYEVTLVRNGTNTFTCDNSNIKSLHVIWNGDCPCEINRKRPTLNTAKYHIEPTVWENLALEMRRGNIPQGPRPYVIWTKDAPNTMHISHKFNACAKLQTAVNALADVFCIKHDKLFIDNTTMMISTDMTLLLSGDRATKELVLMINDANLTIIKLKLYLKCN